MARSVHIDVGMKRIRVVLFVVCGITTAADKPALCLSQVNHQKITLAACERAGYPHTFCELASRASWNVDGEEWSNMDAHAQREPGQLACDALQAASDRVYDLAAAISISKAAGAPFDAAERVGRAMHTLQDECAHHGMTNAQHAYFSLLDTCTSQAVSPDGTDAALTCARSRTEAAFRLLKEATGTGGVDIDCQTSSLNCEYATGPSIGAICDFLSEHRTWDGKETQWAANAGEQLMTAWREGLSHRAPVRVCKNNTDLEPAETVLPHDPPTVCKRIQLACFGKVDADEDGLADEEQANAAAGCSATTSSSAWGLFALVLAGLAFRRKNARRPI